MSWNSFWSAGPGSFIQRFSKGGKSFLLLAALAVIFVSLAAVFLFVNRAEAIVNTIAMDISNTVRLKQGSDFKPIFQIQFGSNENGENLNSIAISFTATSGTPTWTQSSANSSELLDLATTGGGISLWKETNGIPGLQTAGGTPDTQVTLAANPQYGASSAFTITPGTPPALVTDDIYYIALKSDTVGVTNGNAFTATLATNGIVTSVSSPVLGANVITTAITIDTMAPTLQSSSPPNSQNGVDVNTFIDVRFSEAMDNTTLTPANITFTAGGNPVGAGIYPFFDGFNIVVSNPPTFDPLGRFSKMNTVGAAFFPISGNNPIIPQGNYINPALGDIIFGQHGPFPPEIGLITNSTLTSGTFAINGFAPLEGKQLIKFATPAATGAVTDATAVTTGDIMVAHATANPTGFKYDWHMVTAGAAVNNAALRLDGASSAPTFSANTRFSTITPAATATANGATGGGVLAVSLGDMVFTKVAGEANYVWHTVTTAGNLSDDAAENTAELDRNTLDPAVAAGAQMSRIVPGSQGPNSDNSTVFNFGDIVFTKTTANAFNNNIYAFHLVTSGATGITNQALRFDNATTPLQPNTTYSLTIGTGVTDRAGNALASQQIISFNTGSFGGGTQFNPPPFILSTTPNPGGTLPLNGKILIKFSTDMNTAGDGSVINTSNIQLFALSNGVVTGSNLFTSTAGWTYDAPTDQLQIPLPTLTAGTSYRLIIKADNNQNPGDSSCGGTGEPSCVMGADNLALPGPDFIVEFTAQAADSTAPTVQGSFPDNNATGVDRAITDIAVSFSEAIDPATVSVNPTVLLLRDDGDNTAEPGNYDLVTDAGEDTVLTGGSVIIDPDRRVIHFSPNQILNASAKHFLVLRGGANGIKDLAGNALAADAVRVFTTSGNVNGQANDTTAPTIVFANADNFGVFVTFSKALKFNTTSNATEASSPGPNDVNNLANWILETSSDGNNWTNIPLAGKPIRYEADIKTLAIDGLSLPPGQQFRVTVSTAVQDLAGNGFAANARQFVGTSIQSASDTGGQLGPGGGGTVDFFAMGTNPVAVFPKSALAGATTRYRVEFQAVTAIPGGGKITLTYPSGFSFDTTNGDATKRCTAWPTDSFENGDINGPAAGTVTVASIACDKVSRVATIILGATGTQANDFLRFEIQGIINSTVPKDFSTSGYTVDIKTFNAAAPAALLESKTSMPFFISQPGTRSISGTVFVDNGAGGGIANNGIKDGTEAGVNDIKVCLGGPLGFSCTTTTNLFNGGGEYTFGQLTDGFYHINIPPITSGTFTGGPFFRDVNVSGGNVIDVNFPLQQASAQNILDVYISGGVTLANTALDVTGFSTSGQVGTISGPGGPGGFVVREIALDGAGVGTAQLPLTQGLWEIGVWPRMPKEPGSTFAPPDMNFMPPKPVQAQVGANGVPDLCTSGPGAANELCFTLTAASKQIKGKVVDGSGNAVSNAFVMARPAFFDQTTTVAGGGAASNATGNFDLKVINGTYIVEAFVPGMPPASPRECTVKDDSGNVATDNNSTADVFCGGVLIANDVAGFTAASLNLTNVSDNDLVLSLAKGNTSVSGRVLDDQGNAIPFAHVQADEVNDLGFSIGGWRDAPTDNSGNYTLYVTGGTQAAPKKWKITAFAPGFGELPAITVAVVQGDKLTGKNIQAVAGDFVTVSGTVYADANSNNTPDAGEGIQGAFVGIHGSSGGNGTVSNNDGTYSVKVKSGTGYTIEAFVPGQGQTDKLLNQTLTSNQTNKHLRMTSPGTLVVYVCTLTDTAAAPSANNGCGSNQVSNAFVDAFDTNGRGNGTSANPTAGTYTLGLPAGTYTVNAHTPATGLIGSQANVVITTGQTTYINIAPPALFAVSGTVTSQNAACVEGATVWFSGAANGRLTLAQVQANGTFAINLPSGTYNVGVGKQGCVAGSDPGSITVSANMTEADDGDLAMTLVKANIVVQGRVTTNPNINFPAMVVATSGSGRKVVTRVDLSKADTTENNYALELIAGTWTIQAKADGFSSSAATAVLSQNTQSSTQDLQLAAISGYTKKEAKPYSVTPSRGGVVRNTEIGSDFEVNIPAGAFGSSSNAGSVLTKETTAVTDTATQNVIGDKGVDVTPKDASGQPITSLSSSSGGAPTITIPYTDADVTSAGATEGKLVIGAWSDEKQQWEPMSTTCNADTNTCTATVTHFSTFAVLSTGSISTGGGGQQQGGGGGGGGGGGAGGGTGIAAATPSTTTTAPDDPAATGQTVGPITTQSLLIQIQQLLAQIVQLNNQIVALGGIPIPVPQIPGTSLAGAPFACAAVTFERTLRIKDIGDDVKCLQALLNQDPETRVADSGVGSPGNETNYFGSLTAAAVSKFHEKYASEILAPFGLTQGTGLVGQKTREKLNQILGK